MDKKFRNHISIVVEEVWSGVLVLAVFFMTQFLPDLTDLSADDLSFLSGGILWIFLGLAVLLVLVAGARVIVWSKTYICIDENAIVIEKNTLNKKKNTIGIQNISNINLEQNLFEMLFGTCKVKIDTNSASTADKTDVKIILKKDHAERFRAEIMGRMQKAGESGILEQAGEEKTVGAVAFEEPPVSLDNDYDFCADFRDIMQHGLYSISVFSVILLLAGVAVTVGVVIQVVQNPGFVQSLLGAVAGILVALSIIFSALWDTVKDFVKYYDFRVKRRGDRLYIRYGLLKKMEYTIPVDKIQALKINQSFVARISGRYMAEIVNVGMGDEKEEKNSFLVLYCTEDVLRQRIAALLPELSFAGDSQIERQPASIWAIWAPPFFFYALAVILSAVVGTILAGSMDPGVRTLAAGLIWAGAVFLIGIVLACMILSRKTSGIGAGERTLTMCRGYFGRHYTIVKYSNIQYVSFSQNFIAGKWGIKKGSIYLLASSANQAKSLPYFKSGLEEKIKKAMLVW